LLTVDGNLSIFRDFRMERGVVDYLGNQLFINASGEGSYSYVGGSWRNLDLLEYRRLPMILNRQNTTFPFEDQLVGGIRSIYLSGANPADSADLTIAYHQIPGINWDPGFDDQGTPIYYKTNSYFILDLPGAASTEQVGLYISADNLPVINEEDLRIVGNVEA